MAIFLRHWGVIGRRWQDIGTRLSSRLQEWIPALGALAMALALIAQPNMFSIIPDFQVIASWGTERTWALASGFAGVLRIVALAVNSRFEDSRFSPHLRALGAIVGALMWSLFMLGFILSYAVKGTSLVTVVLCGIVAVFELSNVARTSWEVGRAARDRRA